MKRILLFLLLQVSFLVCFADEYIDPQTNVVYTYEPGQATASVKAGYEEAWGDDYGSELEVFTYSGSPDAMGDVVILERFYVGTEEYVVTSIGEFAFFRNGKITSVNIPETVTDIEQAAFANCTNLRSATLPGNVTSIGVYAFAHCDKLEDIYCRAESVPTTDVEAFFGTPIASATLHVPAGSIEKYKTISPWKDFGNIVALEAQYGVSAQELTVSDIRCRLVHNQKNIGDDVVVLYKEGSNLRIDLGYYKCSPFTTGFDITPILRRGNDGAPDSLSVRIDPVVPDSLKNMNVLPQWFHVMFTVHGVEAKSIYLSCLWYEGQVELKEYVVLKDPEVAVTIDNVDYCIYERLNLATLTNGKSANGEIIIPSEISYAGKEYPVKAIKSQAFKACSTITSVTIPNSVTAIENGAFQNSSLTTIYNGTNVEMVQPYAFNGTPWYTNQPDGVIYMGKAVCACKGELPEGTSLTIKEGTLSITQNAFYFCKGLTSITIPEGVTNIDVSSFMGCSDLVSVRLPESLTTIDREAFHYCNKLSSINIPSHVKYICETAFSDCRSLTSVNIPEGVEEIADNAFFGCNQLTDVTIPESLKKIGRDGFYGCKSLSDIRIPDNVEEISYGAFLACTKLKRITLSEKLKYIGEAAFCYCSDLSTIVCNAQIPPIAIPNPDKTYFYSDVFHDVDKQNCKLYVPKGCEEAYKASDLWKDFNIIEMGTGISEVKKEGVNAEGVASKKRERSGKSEKYDDAIYDLQGRHLSAKPAKGMYIQNGRKVALK